MQKIRNFVKKNWKEIVDWVVVVSLIEAIIAILAFSPVPTP